MSGRRILVGVGVAWAVSVVLGISTAWAFDVQDPLAGLAIGFGYAVVCQIAAGVWIRL